VAQADLTSGPIPKPARTDPVIVLATGFTTGAHRFEFSFRPAN